MAVPLMTVIITDTGCKIGPALSAPARINNVSSVLFKANRVIEIVGDVNCEVMYASDTVFTYDPATMILTLA